MARVMIFSTHHPSYSIYAGLDTFFEKRISSGIKKHTIRYGISRKVGDVFSPRVWTGKPYRSAQRVIGEDITIKKIWTFEIKNGKCYINGNEIDLEETIERLSENDGLTVSEFWSWFCDNPQYKKTKTFTGQIICWDDSVEY